MASRGSTDEEASSLEPVWHLFLEMTTVLTPLSTRAIETAHNC